MKRPGIDYGVERFERGKRQSAVLREVATLLEQRAGEHGTVMKATAVVTLRAYQSRTRTDDERFVLVSAADVIDRENADPVLPVSLVADVLRRAAHGIEDICGTEGPVPTIYLARGELS